MFFRLLDDVSEALIGYQKLREVRLRQEVTSWTWRNPCVCPTTYLEVLDGQRSLYSAELTLARARGNEYQSLVQLYHSLGGSWQQ